MFIENKSEWQVLTDDGFCDFEGIYQTEKQDVYNVIFKNGLFLKCSKNHGFYDINSEPISTCNLNIGDKIQTQIGNSEVLEIVKLNTNEHLYDLTDVANPKHSYFTNKILSHNCAFIGSTYTLIEPNKIIEIKRKLEKLKFNPRLIDIDGYNIEIFEEPDYEKCYVLGVDVADGVGGDSSVITVYDITDPLNIKEAARFVNKNCPIPTLAYLTANMGIMYNMSQIMIEANGIGRSLIDILHTVYEYMYIPSIGHKKMGIHSTNKLKLDACSNFRNVMCLSKSNPIIRSTELMTEMENFEKKDTSNGVTYKSRVGHDDFIMTSIWALYILHTDQLDFYFDAVYDNIDLQRFPVKLKSQFSKQQIREDQQFYKKRLNEIKKVVDNVDKIKDTSFVDFTTKEEDASIQPFAFFGN